ncbi:MAG: Rrf2 family transcriptional regulator [Candidatus Ratteibacteria bacterium]|jgi:Rrf2 family protein
MKFSTRVRYGIRALVEIGRRGPGRPVLLKEISVQQRVSFKYLDHIITRLRSHGIVVKTTAKKGGYLLAKSPEEITLYEVIAALDGVDLLDCLTSREVCEYSETCRMRLAWRAFQKDLILAMEKTTLKDFIVENRKTVVSEEYLYHI